MWLFHMLSIKRKAQALNSWAKRFLQHRMHSNLQIYIFYTHLEHLNMIRTIQPTPYGSSSVCQQHYHNPTSLVQFFTRFCQPASESPLPCVQRLNKQTVESISRSSSSFSVSSVFNCSRSVVFAAPATIVIPLTWSHIRFSRPSSSNNIFFITFSSYSLQYPVVVLH